MPEARIGTSSEHLLLIPAADQGPPDELTAALVLGGLTAATVIPRDDLTGFEDLAEFISGLARAWRGWDGRRRWEAADGDLVLEAQHLHGRVVITVTLTQDGAGGGDDGWVVTGDLALEPGAPLTAIAAEVEALAKGGV